MAKQTIAIDIDEVLSPLHDLFFAHHNEVYGTNYPIRDPKGGYFIHEYSDEPKDQLLERIKKFVESEAFKNIVPLEYAVEVLNALQKRFSLIIITSRQDFYEDLTHQWLDKHFPTVFSEVRFTEYIQGKGAQIPKSKICVDMGAEFIIEDNLDTVLDCAKAGVTSLLFGDYPWNQMHKTPKGVVKVKDWKAVEEYFRGVI